jgi:hypothetical protein
MSEHDPEPVADKPAPPRPPKWKRVLRIVLLTLGSLVLVVALLIGFLHTGPGQSLVRRQVERRLGARVNGSVELRELHFALFGRVSLEGLRIRDGMGSDAITLDSLTIVPSWRSLLRGELTLESVSVHGLAVHVRKRADGTSSLDDLFIKPKEEAPTGPSKPPAEKRVVVRALDLAGISFSLENPDGSRVALHDLAMHGSLDAIPAVRTLELHLADVGASLEIVKPEGPTLSVSALKTGLDVSLSRGTGIARIARTRTHLRLSTGHEVVKESDFELGGIEVGIEPGKLRGMLQQLLAGVVVLQSIELRTAFTDTTPKALTGSQHAEIVGLHLDAAKLGALLGKPTLASDVDVEALLSGPSDKLVLSTKVKTSGGTLTLSGKVDASHLDRPGYDLELVAADVASDKLVREVPIPLIGVSKLRLGVKGSGVRKEEAEAEVKLALGPAKIGAIEIESVTLEGRYVRGVVELQSLVVKLFGLEASVHGRYDSIEKRIKASVTLHGDVPKAVAKAKAAGLSVPDRVAALGLQNDAVVEIEGKLGESLSVHLPSTKLAVAGGTVSLDGDATLAPAPESGKALALRSFSGEVELGGVQLGQLAALAGKTLPVSGAASGKIKASGTPEDPLLDFALVVQGPSALKLDVHGHGTKAGIDVGIDASAASKAEGSGKLFTAKATLPLTTSGGTRRVGDGALTLKLDVPKRSIDSIVALLPPSLLAGKKVPSGEVEVHVDLHGTTSRPIGTFAIDLGAALVSPDKTERALLSGAVTGEGARTVITTDTTLWLDAKGEPAATGRIVTKLPRSPLLSGVTDYDWSILFDLKPQMIDELPLPPETQAKLASVNASIGAHVDLHGNRDDVGGSVRLDLIDAIVGLIGPFDANLGVAIAKGDTGLSLDVVFGGTPIVKTTGKVGVAGTGLLAAVRTKKSLDPTLALMIDVPEREVSVGAIHGNWKIGGTATQPTLLGGLVFDKFAMLDDGPGRASLDLAGDRERLRAVLGIGVPAVSGSGSPPVRIEVAVSPNAVLSALASKEGGTVDLELLAKAIDVDVRALVPAFALDKKSEKTPKFAGRLNWDMRATLGLALSKSAPALAKAEVNGKLALTKGSLSIPLSSRTYHDIELELVSASEPLKTLRFSALESDVQNAHRSLSLKGAMGWDKLTPKSASLDLQAHDWLVFGHPKVGPPDAPRGTLTADIHVDANLAPHARSVTATLKQLELLIPDRFARSHFQEVVSLGDVIYLDDPTRTLGKLPVPQKPETPPASEPMTADEAAAEEGTDVHVLAPTGIHVQQFPLDLLLKGEIHAALRPSGRKVRGTLSATGGNITVLGKKHPLSKGSIVFDATHPSGFMDLAFERVPHVSVLRNLGLASAGDAVQVWMSGPIDRPKLAFRGVGNAVLFDNASMENDGHLRWKSEPGLPASATAQGPQMPQIVMSTFMSVNLPHLLFLDRIDVWADPYDERTSYGQLKHLDAEKYSADGKSRLRVIARPPTAGASDAEIGWDRLFTNSSRALFGIGVTAGSRLGGGPGVFFEWSSED